MRIAVVLGVLLLGALNASAANLTSIDSKDGKTRVDLVGEIEPGDEERLKTIVRNANSASKIVVTIRLNSPGGNLLESIKVADIIRSAKISTSVLNGSQCASACFVIFSAGREKFAHYQAQIGVHGASNEHGQETVESSAATVGMARVLKELGVSSAILGKMVVTPPDKMVWLSVDDLRTMDTKMFGKPSQLADPTPNQLPTDISPKPRASASASQDGKTSTPTWRQVVEKALKVSSAQNGGRARYTRNCQPEAKVCNMAVFYRNSEGHDAMVRVAEDLNGSVVERELCTFNSHGDIRTCFDWDKGTTHRDMKNRQGQWYAIAAE